MTRPEYTGWRAEMDRIWRQFVVQCESIEEAASGSPSDISTSNMSEREKIRVTGFVEGMKHAAKAIRRSVDHPRYDKVGYPIFNDERKDDFRKQRINDLEAALNLALCKLIKLEPSDSCAVSDEYVAMAAVHAGGEIINQKSRDIIQEALIREQRDELIVSTTERVSPSGILDIKKIRDDYGVSMADAVRIFHYAQDGTCNGYDEAARFVHNLALTIYVPGNARETDAQAKHRWALQRAQQGIPNHIGIRIEDAAKN